MRKVNSKVNVLKRDNLDLRDQVEYHATVVARTMTWLKANLPKESHAEFTTFLGDLTNELADKYKKS